MTTINKNNHDQFLLPNNFRHLPNSRAMGYRQGDDGAKTITGQLNQQQGGASAGARGTMMMTERKRKQRINFGFLVYAIITNSTSLAFDESRWYWGEGGGAFWMINISTLVSNDEGDNDDDDHEENDKDTQIKNTE